MNFGEKSGTKREVVHFEKTKGRNGRKISAKQNTEMVVLIRIIVIIMMVIVIFMIILASKMIIIVLIMITLTSDTMVIFFYFGLKDDDNSYLYDNLSLEAQGVETFPLLKQRDGCLCSET